MSSISAPSLSITVRAPVSGDPSVDAYPSTVACISYNVADMVHLTVIASDSM